MWTLNNWLTLRNRVPCGNSISLDLLTNHHGSFSVPQNIIVLKGNSPQFELWKPQSIDFDIIHVVFFGPFFIDHCKRITTHTEVVLTIFFLYWRFERQFSRGIKFWHIYYLLFAVVCAIRIICEYHEWSGTMSIKKY